MYVVEFCISSVELTYLLFGIFKTRNLVLLSASRLATLDCFCKFDQISRNYTSTQVPNLPQLRVVAMEEIIFLLTYTSLNRIRKCSR